MHTTPNLPVHQQPSDMHPAFDNLFWAGPSTNSVRYSHNGRQQSENSTQSPRIMHPPAREARMESLEARLAKAEENHRAEVASLRYVLQECIRAIEQSGPQWECTAKV